ncbi:MAG: tripartite tricarboxylate transporter substrate binding protein [Aquisalimonadaceae bacterium]
MMKSKALLTSLVCVLPMLLAVPAAAQSDYPSRPVQLIVPFGAGDAIDGTARLMSRRLQEELGVPFVVRNVPGAGGGVGMAEANKADPDGYTLLVASTGAMTARPQISDSGYKTDDFVTIAQLVEVPIGLAVADGSEFESVKDVIAAAKANPGSVKYSTPGPGSTQHLSMERFARDQGIELTHIGGRGGKGAVTKALTQEVDFVFVGASNYTSLSKAGQLRVLGVAAPETVSYLPDAPTFQELGYDFNAAVWFGLVTNRGIADDRLQTLRAAVDKVANSGETQELYGKYNLTPAYLNHDAFTQLIAETVEENAQTLKTIGLIQ